MQKKIYTVATAHLDTIWSWDFETTVSRYIYNTLVDNFALFQKYPTYHFNFEGSYRYELMEEYYPELYAKMRDYIAQGRWSVCGSAFENGDVNVPSPEALFRNILYGNRYFEKKFGKRSVDIYLPDCFGFGWALPSIIAHANLMGFTTQKLGWGGAYGIPFDVGVWQGPDGAQVLASLNPHDYYFTLKKLRDWDFVQQKLDENEKYDLNSTMIFHGIGDRGGAPKEASVAFVEQEINKNQDSDVQVLASGADDLFRDLNAQLTPAQKAKLPRWETELVMQNHGVGGYTSRAVGKRWNRRCQELADMAERSGVVADYLGTAHYNKEAMELNWKRTIAHQFHDDLPGTSVQRAYRRSWNDYGMAMNGFAGELTQAAGSVGSLLKTDFCAGTPVTVFNSLEVARTDAVTLELPHWPKACARVYDPKGREVKSQVNRYENGTAELVFVATVPALGFAVYDVRPSDVPCRLRGSLSISSENQMENQKYIVRLNKKGNITSILDKEMDEQELLAEPISLGLFKYTGSKPWPAWEMNYKEANKDPDRLPNPVTVTIQEKGPARVSFCVEQKDGDSTFKNIIALTDGGSRVEVYSEIEWRSLHTMAKNKFAFACTNPEATFDLGLGAIRRGNMTAGLSLGEYSAYVASGAMDFEEAVALVQKRGRFMTEAVPSGEGAMYAIIGLDQDLVEEACDEATALGMGLAVPANYNAPGQIVIAGKTEAVAKAAELAKEKGAKLAVKLKVSGPFHTSLLQPASDKLKPELEKLHISDMKVPVYTNVNAQIVADKDDIIPILTKQICCPVRWADIIRNMNEQGADTFIELGPGKALTGFVKRTLKGVNILNVEDLSSLDKTMNKLHEIV